MISVTIAMRESRKSKFQLTVTTIIISKVGNNVLPREIVNFKTNILVQTPPDLGYFKGRI
jgi:hypothetical protein